MHTLVRFGIGAVITVVLACTEDIYDSDFETTTARDPSTASADAGRPDLSAVAGNLSDAQIAGVVTAVNLGEVEHGLIALTLARRQEVRDFATQMVDAHQQAQKREAALFFALGIRPRSSDTSERLRATSQQVATNLLSKESRESFDFTYVQVQVSVHRQVLALLDRNLISGADDLTLVVALSSMREEILSHLQTASALLDTLPAPRDAGTPANNSGTGSTSGAAGGATSASGGGAPGTGSTVGVGVGVGGAGGNTAGTGGATSGTGGAAGGGTFSTTGSTGTTGGTTGSASGAGPGFGSGGTSFSTGGATGSASGAGPGFGSGGTSFGSGGATGSASGAGPGFGSGGTSFGTGGNTGSTTGAGSGTGGTNAGTTGF